MDAFVKVDKENIPDDWLDKIVRKFHQHGNVVNPKKKRGVKRISIYDLAEEYLEKKRFSYDHTKAFRVLVRDLARYEAFKNKVLREKFAWNIDKITKRILRTLRTICVTRKHCPRNTRNSLSQYWSNTLLKSMSYTLSPNCRTVARIP